MPANPAMPGRENSEATLRARAQRVGLGVGHDVHHAGLAAVRRRAAERLHVDLLAGHRLDHVRSGDEDPAVRRHDHDVGQRRPVGGAAGGRAEHDGDLRDPAGGPDHRGEHLADAVQRLDALGQPGAAGVPQADHRDALADRRVDRVDDVPAALVAHRAAHPGAVGAERDHLRRRRSGRAPPSTPEVSVACRPAAVPASSSAASRTSGSRGSIDPRVPPAAGRQSAAAGSGCAGTVGAGTSGGS